MRCVNCQLRIARLRRHRVFDENAQLVEKVRRWVYPRDITHDCFICHSCWELINHEPNQDVTRQQLGHRNVCAGCGRSILRIRSRLLTNNDEICVPCYLRAQRVLGSSQRSSTLVPPSTFRQSDTQPEQQTEVIPSTSGNLIDETSAEQILPATFTDDTAEDDEVSLHITSPPLQVTSAEQITLPTLRRAADTARRCLFLECNDSEKRRVPDGLRKQIIKDFNFYIPRNARSCTFHLGANLFHELYAAENALSTFSAAHIEEIVFLLAEETQLDFQNPENIDDHLFKYWFGRTKAEFNEVLVEVPQLNDAKMKNGFSALLCKMRTGDSDERISTLFKIPRRTLEDHMNKARGILCQYYVPRHLGWAHKPRQEFVARNTALAEHLFGNPETPSEERRLIAIADGTYLSNQKSSNYSFQKATYSLHKYYNLVKPFLIVCCDGYIIEAMGPYPATKNDASIMNDIMSEGGAFTHLFREDDVFILDRGFRDCADNMTDKGFFIHMPETISTGERQLSTLQANISRCVTMNRWVVEAVNGRFSRDFKIFREVYLNKRCPHIMEDFRIAAAFLNHFAVQFRERANVREIIEIIDAKIFEDNELCEVVQQHNLNMRSTLFQSISHTNIEFPELTINDLELIALGTYQIRQAKSYVGEHLRVHGMYTLEVCQDNAPLQGIFNDSHLLYVAELNLGI
ncbi:hypothetical protein HF086_009490 [Spodoptera exigua]|uniref:DDE Tnp4 domain-containing protein n=1 Tax=Spodoptera exigua TaxID=7107 RepID=A0A922SEX9_SPOEX|nr:hypothetical protein HF086_009490 [Spodoptera exigua]